MKVTVNPDACLLHGQCVIAAPAVFSFDEGGKLVWVTEPEAGLRSQAEEAADACPEQAITIEG